MPWKECTRMSARAEFVELAKREGAEFRALCEAYGISRKTGYKWCERFAREGEAGLRDRSRRPRRSPARTSGEVEAQVLCVRDAHPSWGARKIAKILSHQGVSEVPAPSTITAILARHGRISEEESLKRKAFTRFERARPNELWQMDFKGHFGLKDGSRCHPLVVLDDHSRFCLALRACGNEQGETVQRELTEIFRESGLPEEMLMDNGSPWGSDRVNVYTPLVMWLIRLGLRVTHGRPRHPQTQGKLERLNLTLDLDLLLRRVEGFEAETDAQNGFDVFRSTYNHERPHESLEMEVPASRYRPSERSMPEELPPVEYEEGDQVRQVQQGGRIGYKGREYRLPKAFRGQPVALRPTEVDGEISVYFCKQRIAIMDLKEGVARTVRG
jgi:transposase InsO family protein